MIHSPHRYIGNTDNRVMRLLSLLPVISIARTRANRRRAGGENYAHHARARANR